MSCQFLTLCYAFNGLSSGGKPAYRHGPCSIIARPVVYLCDDILIKEKCCARSRGSL